jgi:hypothetical protein
MNEECNSLPGWSSIQTSNVGETNDIALNLMVNQFEAPRCPICSEKIVRGACETHGTICETCGTIYPDPFCPNCYPSVAVQLGEGNYYVVGRRAEANPENLRLGEQGIPTKEFGAITGRQSVTRKESNILRAATDEEPTRKKIRQKAEAAIKWLNLPRNKEMALAEAVERTAVSLITKYRTGTSLSGRKIHVSIEKVVEYCLLTEAKKIGRSIREVQEALARAGFNIKLQIFRLRIAVPHDIEISFVKLYVNGWRREQGFFKPKQVRDGPIGREYSVTVQILLSDTIDQKGRIGEQTWIKIHFENAVILPDESVADQVIGRQNNGRRYASSSQRTIEKRGRIGLLQKDPNTIWLKLSAEKCFALFKDMNRMLERSSSGAMTGQLSGLDIAASTSAEIEGSIRQHLSLPSKKFPASAALMQRARCLAKVERRSVELFRESLKDSEGKSQKTLAHDALVRADQEVYSSLSPSVKLALRSYVSTLPLRRRDRCYTGVKGLLILSEVLPG